MICFFPIEITARETVGHIFTAAALADSGVSSILGHKQEVAHFLRRCSGPKLVFYKGDRREVYVSEDDIAVGQDPEAGIVYASFTDFFKRRPVSVGRLGETSGYFCYGHQDYNFLRAQFPDVSDKIYLTGSPRVDSWLPASEELYAFEMRKIRSKYGNFVLLASSGGRANLSDLQRLIAGATTWDAEKVHARQSFYESNCDLILEIALNIRAKTEFNVVVRPHPAESYSRWLEDIRGIQGVYVDSAYDLNAWVRSAHAVVQNNSTAAFEAWHSNIPVFAVPQLAQLKWHDYQVANLPVFVANRIAITLESVEELVMAIGNPDEIWKTNRLDEAKNVLVNDRTLTEAGWSALKIASIISNLSSGTEYGPTRYDYVCSALPQIRPGLSPISGRERLGRRGPPPFKRWNLGARSMHFKLEAASKILGLAKKPSMKRIGFNTFLIRP